MRNWGPEVHQPLYRRKAGLAFNEALDVFEREIQRMRDRREQQRTMRPPEPPVLGIVDRVHLDKGFGFILTDWGERVYFHRNAVTDSLQFERLEEGQRVALNIEGGIEGPQATVVVAPPPGLPAP